MIKPTMQRILATALQLLLTPRRLAIFAALYAGLLATVYGFVVVREATIAQVLLTLVLVVAAPIEFFILQALILETARDPRFGWRRTFQTSLKLIAASLPLLIIGAGLFLALNQWQSHYPAPVAPPWLIEANPVQQNIHRPTFLFSTLRWLLFGVALPLFLIHLWIGISANDHRVGAGSKFAATWRIIRQTATRAFTPSSMLTYTIGLLLFAMVPYAILFARIPINGARTDFAVFIARLLLLFAVTLFGWLLTVTTLARETFDLELQINDERDALRSLDLQVESL
jgi:hypothetical protein